MKNFTLSFLGSLFVTTAAFAQFSTGTVQLLNTPGLEYDAKIDVSATLVTVTLTAPSDRWLGLGFGASSMAAGGDCIIFNGTTISDRTFNGVGIVPVIDAVQSWTLASNTVNAGIRTVVATRALTTGEANDYVFANAAAPLTLVFARGESLTVEYHGFGNCGTTTTSLALGTDTFSLRTAQVYPNPSNGEFVVKTNTALQKITIYTLTGSFVKTIEVQDSSENVEVNISGLQTGVYLMELQNDSEKFWKKVIVN